MDKIPEDERKVAIEKLNIALTTASDSVSKYLNLNDAAKCSIQNLIAEAFGPTLIELGFVKEVKDDSIPS